MSDEPMVRCGSGRGPPEQPSRRTFASLRTLQRLSTPAIARPGDAVNFWAVKIDEGCAAGEGLRRRAELQSL